MRAPIDTTVSPSIAHIAEINGINPKHMVCQITPEGGVYWQAALAPEMSTTSRERDSGRIRSCGYCGSMHPTDVVAAFKAGATGEWSDFKYGWPHKLYLDSVPNPHAGMLEVRCSSSHPDDRFPRKVSEPRFDIKTGERIADYVTYTEDPKPARATTGGKFYTVHLLDATPQERAIIENLMGRKFTFHGDGTVEWERIGNVPS